MLIIDITIKPKIRKIIFPGRSICFRDAMNTVATNDPIPAADSNSPSLSGPELKTWAA